MPLERIDMEDTFTVLSNEDMYNVILTVHYTNTAVLKLLALNRQQKAITCHDFNPNAATSYFVHS